MTIKPLSAGIIQPPLPTAPRVAAKGTGQDDPALRETFDAFVGEAFFGQMIQAARQTVGKPAYFHGGRAEEVFQGQLDQVLAQTLSKSSAATISEPMYKLFTLNRRD